MTPEERAERIAQFLDKTPLKRDGIHLIAAQIREVREEGFNAAREKAEEIAHKHNPFDAHIDDGSSEEHLCSRCGWTIADRIRQMEAE